MLGELVAIAKSAAIRCLSAGGSFIQRHLQPAPEMIVAGVVQDVVSSRSELIAENAMLRQQLIVARRAVKKPAVRDRERLLLVLLARFNRA